MTDSPNYAEKLVNAFDKVIQKDYSNSIAPPSIITPFNIKPLDTLLGGGLSSSLPIAFSSTPESGKSTIAWQFAKQFLDENKNGIVFYADIEGASNNHEDNKLKYIQDRMKIFDIDESRCMYKCLLLDTVQLFELLYQLVDLKNKLKEKFNEEVPMLFVWDSIASTPSSKDLSADDPNSVIGFKARELTFLLNKYKPLFALNRITSIFIDQVRSNINIKATPYQKAPEKSVGNFSDEFKAATNISA